MPHYRRSTYAVDETKRVRLRYFVGTRTLYVRYSIRTLYAVSRVSRQTNFGRSLNRHGYRPIVVVVVVVVVVAVVEVVEVA